MEKSKLVEGYKRVLNDIYTPKKYFERTLTLMSRIPSGDHKINRIDKGDIKGFMKSFIVQTVSRYGFRYLLFLFPGALLNPKNFALAINIAVKGHHFFTITRLTLAPDEIGFRLVRFLHRFKSKIGIKSRHKIFIFITQYAFHLSKKN